MGSGQRGGPVSLLALPSTARLALPVRALTCEWCATPLPAYGPDECAACVAKFKTTLAAEKDFRARVIVQAAGLMAEWVRDWAHHPALTASEPSELFEAAWEALRGSATDEPDMSPLEVAFAAAWTQERGVKL